MTRLLLDVSRWQAGLDLAAARAQGFTAVNVQLTGRSGYVHAAAPAYVLRARDLGMGVCVYHWLDNAASGAEQAATVRGLIAAVGGPHELAHQVDCESTATPATWPIWRDYTAAMQDHLGRHVAAYTGDWWWTPRGWAGAELTPYLWAAPNIGYVHSYPGDDSPLWTAGYGGWPHLSLMQYAVADVAGTTCTLSALRDPGVWAALTGDTVPWYLNTALTNFRNAVNAAFPRRDKTSDGTVGDLAHQATDSDHNPDPVGEPDAGSVDAWDMDVNLGSGNDPAAIEDLKRVFEAHEASRYWIHNRLIASRADGWVRRGYDGPNPHDQHVHWNTRETHEASSAPWTVEGIMTAQAVAEAFTAGATRTGEVGRAMDDGFSAMSARLFRNDAAHKALIAAVNATATGVVGLAATLAPEVAAAIRPALDALKDALAELHTQVQDVPGATMALLGDSDVPVAKKAAALRDLLGDDLPAVMALLSQRDQ